MRIAWAGLASMLILIACSPVEMEMGNGGTPAPTTPDTSATPNPALFGAVQATFVEETCGQTGCHIPPTGTSNLAIYDTAGASTAEVALNATQTSCGSRVDTYDPPSGVIVAYFCNANGTAMATQHSARTLTDPQCASLLAWLESGSGIPPNCP